MIIPKTPEELFFKFTLHTGMNRGCDACYFYNPRKDHPNSFSLHAVCSLSDNSSCFEFLGDKQEILKSGFYWTINPIAILLGELKENDNT